MDLTTRLLTMGASGSGSAPTYVEDVFSTWLYTGQGTGTVMTVDNGIDLAGKGGMVWLKARSTTFDHELIDTVRGTRKAIRSNTTAAQVTNGDLGEFTSSGFKLGGTGSGGFQVGIGDTYASWTFRKAAKFFDVVTFTAGSNTNRRISHSLGSVPGTIIIKSTSAIGAWYVYHRSLGRSSYIVLNTTGGSTTQTNFWGTSDPTSTDFGLDETAAFAAGTSAVAYLFAHDTGTDGLIQCGTSTSGTFNNLGWEPQWVLAKPTTNDSWYI